MAKKRRPSPAPVPTQPSAPPPPSSSVPPEITFLASPAELGRAIRAARSFRDITQAELAGRAHVSRRFVIQLEEGKQSAHLGKVLTVMMCAGLMGIVLPIELAQAAMGSQ
jgi:DNA-binding XRE family transcriptional regulator